jgi:hypothetical protein
MHRHMPTLFMFLGVGFLAFSVYDYCTCPDGPGAFIEKPEREFLDLSGRFVGRVEFALQNPTRHVVRCVGLAPC